MKSDTVQRQVAKHYLTLSHKVRDVFNATQLATMQFWFFNKSLRNSFPVASNFSVASVQHLKNWEPTLQTFQHGNFQNATPQQTQNSWEHSLNMFCVAKPGQTFQQWHYVIVSKRFWKFRRVVSFLGQHIFFHLAFLMSILWMVARVATHIVLLCTL